jgi:hypothetical protein
MDFSSAPKDEERFLPQHADERFGRLYNLTILVAERAGGRIRNPFATILSVNDQSAICFWRRDDSIFRGQVLHRRLVKR